MLPQSAHAVMGNQSAFRRSLLRASHQGHRQAVESLSPCQPVTSSHFHLFLAQCFGSHLWAKKCGAGHRGQEMEISPQLSRGSWTHIPGSVPWDTEDDVITHLIVGS